MLSSRLEGGANALAEIIVAGTPVLVSRIAGNVGMLGKDYPGYFNAGDTRGLARLLERAENDAEFLQELRNWVNELAANFAPGRELAAWASLLNEVFTSRN